MFIIFIYRYIKTALLPSVPPLRHCTRPVRDLKKANFEDTFNIPVPATKICTKTLQVNVWSRFEQQQDVCVVSVLCDNFCSISNKKQIKLEI